MYVFLSEALSGPLRASQGVGRFEYVRVAQGAWLRINKANLPEGWPCSFQTVTGEEVTTDTYAARTASVRFSSKNFLLMLMLMRAA